VAGGSAATAQTVELFPPLVDWPLWYGHMDKKEVACSSYIEYDPIHHACYSHACTIQTKELLGQAKLSGKRTVTIIFFSIMDHKQVWSIYMYDLD
jgi:hypothetical protein